MAFGGGSGGGFGGGQLKEFYYQRLETKAQTMRRTAEKLIEGYNIGTEEAILAPRAGNCMHYLLPESLNRPASGNKEYAKFALEMIGTLHGFKITILDIVADAEASKAVVHAKGTADSQVGPYCNEYAIFLTFNFNGDEVTRIEEFVDSAFSTAFFAKLSGAKEGRQ